MHNNGRRSLRALIPAIALSFAWGGGAAAAAIKPFALPGALSPRDDGSLAAIPIGFPINFFGVTHTQLVVIVVRNGAIAQADLAIAADIDDDGDKLGFEFMVRNGGQLESNAHPLSL